jgi:RNA-binding protein YlmH
VSEREKLVNHIPPGEYREVVQAVIDKALRVSQTQQPAWTYFYELGVIRLAVPIISQVPNIRVEISGGQEKAERARLAILPDWLKNKEFDQRISYLKIEPGKQMKVLTHRDYLGALLGLGIKREKIGDLIITPNCCQVIMDADLAQYVKLNLAKVGNNQVTVSEIDKPGLDIPSESIAEVITSVASLRLDAVLAAGFNFSREKAAQYIKGEKVKLNWLSVIGVAKQVKEGDLISCRGIGRIKIAQVLGETKKGRQKVIFHKFS